MSGYAEYCLWVVGLLWAVWALLWAVWASLGYLLEGSGPVGSGGLTSRVCVFTKGTSPSRRVPSYNLLQVGAHAADPAHGLRAGGHVHEHAHDGKGRGTPRLK